ncbi:hypothetical protein Tco_0092517 [Tanacetum coccineum]
MALYYQVVDIDFQVYANLLFKGFIYKPLPLPPRWLCSDPVPDPFFFALSAGTLCGRSDGVPLWSSERVSCLLDSRRIWLGYLLSTSQSSILPFSDRLPPIMTVFQDIRDVLLLLSLLLLLARWEGVHLELLLPFCIPLVIRGVFLVPRDTINDMCPNVQDISPLNPNNGVVAGVIRLLTIGRSLLKQWLSCPSLLVSGGNEISWFAEKL